MKLLPFAAFCLLSAGAAATSKSDSLEAPTLKKAAQTAVARYADHVHSTYVELQRSTRALDSALQKLAFEPTAANLSATREAWKLSRDVYSKTEAFRFYGGPIDDAEDGPEGFLNAWPIDESYIDSVRGAPASGLVNQAKQYPKLEEALLLDLNEKNGEKNISTGYHAIEFLLWGQDFNPKGPGQRPITDFQVKQPNDAAARRLEYLATLTKLLNKQVESLIKDWEPNSKASYATALKKESANEALRRIFTGITTLTLDEMAGERMTVPLEVKDQENEQDCFSDYTLHDFVSNQQGIVEIIQLLGPLLEASNRDLFYNLNARYGATSQALEKLRKVGPFDQIVAPNGSEASKQLVREAIAALEAQSAAMAAVGRALGLELNVE
jgi:putative iron-regulated protein